MKKVKTLPILFILLFLVALVGVFFGYSQGKTASADTDRLPPRPTTETYVEAYDISMDVKADRTIKIVEDITVYFYNNSGFIRDIPTNGGEVVHNLKVYEMVDGNPTSVYYSVDGANDGTLKYYVSVDIGDFATKFREYRTYRIEYDYCLTKAQEGSDLLALTPVGAGWDCPIFNISINLTLPDGSISDGKTICYTRNTVTEIENDVDLVWGTTADGKTTLSAEVAYIGSNTQVRVDVHFEDGVLSTYFDFTPYICVIIGAVLILVLVGAKFLFFNKNTITPVINFEAPNKMDPLMMGKLIDNKVDNSDITSLIYYFADKGWLKIAFEENDKEPTLIRTVKNLPDECTDYEKLTFNKLFSIGYAVRPSDLKNRFYTVIPQITAMVNAKTKNLYSKKSFIAAAVFAVLGGLLLGITPLCLALAQISPLYSITSLLVNLIVVIPAFVFFGLALAVKYNSLKLSVGAQVLRYLGIAVLCAIASLVYCLLVPSNIIALPAKILLCAVFTATTITSVILVSRTKEYVSKLNDIIGFKNFIKLAEKNQLELMLEDDPQLYYHILPYAQVLGVSGIWEEKFKDITIQPPDWATTRNVVAFYAMNIMIRNSFSSLSRGMVTRPNSSGSRGFGGGGGFGGPSGGGPGGGGGRFR